MFFFRTLIDAKKRRINFTFCNPFVNWLGNFDDTFCVGRCSFNFETQHRLSQKHLTDPVGLEKIFSSGAYVTLLKWIALSSSSSEGNAR